MTRHETAVDRRVNNAGVSKKRVSAKVKPYELVAFIYQFNSMYEAGVPILQCLEALSRQTENIGFKHILREVITDIQSGSTLSNALAGHPRVFSTFFVNMVRAGEKGGIINKIMERLAIYIEKTQEMKRKVRDAFAYPLTVGVLAFVVMIFLVIVIIPVFQDVYEGLRITLPLPTRMIIGMSEFMRKLGLQFFLLSAGAGLLIYRFRHVEAVRWRIDRIKNKIPFFGRINIKVAVLRFIRTFGDMLESNVTVSEAIKTAKDVTGNIIIEEIIEKMQASINRGGTLTDAMEEQEIIPPSVVQMISVGESSGKLPHMLGKSAIALERDLDVTIKRVLVMVEPALILLMACFVAFIAISIYLPMFDILSLIQQR